MSKIMFKLNKKYLAIFAICVAIIVVSLNSNYSFITRFFECLFNFDDQLNFLYEYGVIPTLNGDYGFFEIYMIYNDVFYYGYASMIIWSTQLFQILLPVIAAIGSFWIFKEWNSIDFYVLSRKDGYAKYISKKVVLNSLKVAIAFFAAYLLLLIFVDQIADKENLQIARYILTDIFSEDLYYDHIFIYFFLEGFIRFFIMPFVYSFFASVLALVVTKPWQSFLYSNLYYFALTLVGGIILYLGGIGSAISNIAIYFMPSLLMGSGDYYGFSTILIILTNCIPLFLGIFLIYKKARSYERL